jgi:hypothetical protein
VTEFWTDLLRSDVGDRRRFSHRMREKQRHQRK